MAAALGPSVADPCMNMITDKDSASSSKYTPEPHSPALLFDHRKHRNQSKTRNDCVEILPGLFESTCFDKYLALSLGDDLSFQDTDIFDMHRDIVKSIGREPKISFQADGTLLIEAISPEESEKIKKFNKIRGYKVDCKRHQSMNSCRGVIFSKQLLKYSEEKLLQEFKDQQNNSLGQTSYLVLTLKTPLSIIWKKIWKISGKFVPSPPPALDINGHITIDPETVSNCFAEHFARISRKSVESPGHDLRVRDEMKNLDFRTNDYKPYNLPFTEKEYDSALASCNDTAPGPDGIPYIMLRHVSPSAKNFIIQLFTRIWFENAFPSSWELAHILLFSKPGKASSKVTNRPIALTSCLCKLMEKMVNARLVWFLEHKGILSPSQCGFC